MSDLTIVTAVYYSTPMDVMGGRGWNFTYYKPTLFAMSRLNAKKVVVYHDEYNKAPLQQFVTENNLCNFELKLVPLDNLPYYTEIFKLKSSKLEQHFSSPQNSSENIFLINSRLHLICLLKLWFLSEEIKHKNLIDTPIAWIDAGLFHHALFPESLGGVELAKFKIENYHPLNETTKITPELGEKLERLMCSSRLISFCNLNHGLVVNWTTDIDDTQINKNLIGGMFGGLPDVIATINKKFYSFLDTLIKNDILSLEEIILSKIYTDCPDLFLISEFTTWYHDVASDPCYTEGAILPDSISFYKSFFDFIENNIPVKQSKIITQSVELDYSEKFELPNIAIYGSHNASISVEYNGTILEVIELERFINTKNAGYAQYYVAGSRKFISKFVLEYLNTKYGFSEYGYVLHQHCDTNEDGTLVQYWKQFPGKKYIECRHHESHASGAFYQSPFDKALIVSFDGGGNDGQFNIYTATREHGTTLINSYRLDLGFPYMIFGEFLKDIKKENSLALANLIYSGKILGLQSYAHPVAEWLPAFKNFYYQQPTGNNYQECIDVLGKNIGLDFSIDNRLEGDVAYKVAATSQAAFEEIFFEHIDPIMKNYPDLPICLTGGCALNITLNTKIKTRYNRSVFVGPNPNDCGLSVGMLANLIKPMMPIDITYAGVPILDKNKLPEYTEKYNPSTKSIEELAGELESGKIVGIIHGNSEHGPRALGNRSILCNPLIKNARDVINDKVKHREWYRPFSPVVRLEDVSEYFNWDEESRWMSFCPTVKEKYLSIIPAVVHIDNTARVQTVTREQNEFLYNLLTEFKKLTGVGVLLNTSFNVDGKPILSTYADAFSVLEKTELDSVYIDGLYFNKKIGIYHAN